MSLDITRLKIELIFYAKLERKKSQDIKIS